MPTSGRRRLGVRISQDVWVDEVERLSARSRARVAAERERPRLERDGVELRSCSPARTWVPMGRGCEVSTRSTCRSAMLRHPRGPSRSCSRWPSETVRCTCGSSRSERGIRRAERGACTSGRTSACTVATRPVRAPPERRAASPSVRGAARHVRTWSGRASGAGSRTRSRRPATRVPADTLASIEAFVEELQVGRARRRARTGVRGRGRAIADRVGRLSATALLPEPSARTRRGRAPAERDVLGRAPHIHRVMRRSRCCWRSARRGRAGR